jgi:3-hydroxyacyl-[acyl-carrier-protein] dehydratase
MRFVLIDRIVELQSGHSLVAVKNLSLAEEYLADHFPGFPVMPGVLMLEALTQAGAWLVREMEDFAHSIVVLKLAKTIKYGSFVEPGRQLRLHVELTARDERECSFKGAGTIDGQEMVKGRFILTRYNLRERDPALHTTDAQLVAGLRDLYGTLRKGSVGARAMLRAPGAEVAAAALAGPAKHPVS